MIRVGLCANFCKTLTECEETGPSMHALNYTLNKMLCLLPNIVHTVHIAYVLY